ncbi:histidinol dehydrogenase [Lipingzhangella sp. LS1_29]|uniref:Histidinol dehydrogenase n=1 Tax=Lipingzhangella rawalii TaxID=2055835 RepID=A0ABU2H242_9ACTN|nr:histidinol dehydrogenase [Lipingzhangella rawalii]MDS1269361.1 histidinol dehydrogenase [Lipingzhangella rawalii]
MLTRIDLRDTTGDPRTLLPRADLDVDAALELVRPSCAAVAERGLPALLELTERFDGVRMESLRVPPARVHGALSELDPELRAALEESIRRARAVHAAQRPQDTSTSVVPGGTVTQRWIPVERVGLYAPGGRAVYPSSVIMNVVPAQEAGVGSLAVASPPQPDFGGLPHPTILAACALLGVDEVYAVGGAQAVAMFAYGTTECDPADMVTGPGSVWVAAAKRLLKGRIGIDTEAGPTEIAVLADDTADAALVAADLVSQAEHDPLAAAVLVTDSERLADAVETQLARCVEDTKHSERVREALTGVQSGVVLVRDSAQGIEVVNAYAAEHLQIMTAAPDRDAARIRNAGAIFLGPYSPVSLGDYCAGSNHVLPTGGYARHSGGLSVGTFLRGVQVIDYDRSALTAVSPQVRAIAEAEDFPAHGAAITARTEQIGGDDE